MIAALYVQRNGVYYGLDNVDPWDEERDARLYQGPHPVVAHPPCSRWCRLAGLVEARWGHKKGDDGGCFAAALHAVRTEPPPELDWTVPSGTAWVSWGDFDRYPDAERLSKAEGSRTPLPFRDLLLTIARGAQREAA
jgi:hypothetical protein